MTQPAASTPTVACECKLLSVLAGVLLASGASFAQVPATAGVPAAQAPLEAYTDPGWTGRPQPAAVLRKEAAAALAQGRQVCAEEADPQQRRQCLDIVREDHRQMLKRIDSRPRR